MAFVGQGLRKNTWEYGIDFALNSGDNIPAIGLGTWKIPQEELPNTLRNAVSLGYRHFDFSTFGDGSEIPGGEILGKEFLHNSAYGRSSFFLTGKLSPGSQTERSKVVQEVERLIRVLHCNHLDLLLIQYPTGSLPIGELWKILETQMNDGKFRALGVSNFTLDQLRDLCSKTELVPAVLQMECHPFAQQRELIDFCHKKGIHITAYSPLGSDGGVQQICTNQTLLGIGKKYNKSPSQVVIRWNIQNGRSVIPRTSNLQHLKENLQVFDFQLSNEDLKMIDSLDRGQIFVQPEKHVGGIGKVVQEETQKSQVGAVGMR